MRGAVKARAAKYTFVEEYSRRDVRLKGRGEEMGWGSRWDMGSEGMSCRGICS